MKTEDYLDMTAQDIEEIRETRRRAKESVAPGYAATQ